MDAGSDQNIHRLFLVGPGPASRRATHQTVSSSLRRGLEPRPFRLQGQPVSSTSELVMPTWMIAARVSGVLLTLVSEGNHVVAHLAFNHGNPSARKRALPGSPPALQPGGQLTLGCTGLPASTSNQVLGIWPAHSRSLGHLRQE